MTFILKVEQATESPNSQTVVPIAKGNKSTILDQKKLALPIHPPTATLMLLYKILGKLLLEYLNTEYGPFL